MLVIDVDGCSESPSTSRLNSGTEDVHFSAFSIIWLYHIFLKFADNIGPIQVTLTTEAEGYRKTMALLDQSAVDDAKSLPDRCKESWGR